MTAFCWMWRSPDLSSFHKICLGLSRILQISSCNFGIPGCGRSAASSRLQLGVSNTCPHGSLWKLPQHPALRVRWDSRKNRTSANMKGSWKGDPHIIHFNGNVPYKPSIFGYLHFRKPPYEKQQRFCWRLTLRSQAMGFGYHRRSWQKAHHQ